VPRRYRVELLPAADHDVSALYTHIAQDAPQTARRWAKELRRQMRTLKTFPESHERIPEHAHVGEEYRHLLYGNFRVIYRVEKNRVVVVRVIRAAQLLERSMLPES
jgi:toxin ParE1/3/4